MISVFGISLLHFSFVTCLISIIFILLGSYFNRPQITLSGKNALISSALSIIISAVLLIKGFINNDFSIKYISAHTAKDTPLAYKIGGLWAGMEGSILFWLFILSIYILIIIFIFYKYDNPLFNTSFFILGCIQFFFLIICNFFENPFILDNNKIFNVSGSGLNPLLQHPAMLVHPPMLYIGYIGFSVPFAFAASSLIHKRSDSYYLHITRGWTIFTWMILSVAIVLGGWWAYLELGWGGYWAWDPVENASFMPWLTGTAYLHSVLIEQKRGMLKKWNAALIMLTFTLTIFGTYLTRSGIVSSIHAFAATDLGIWFFCFIVIIIIFCLLLFFIRRHDLKSDNKIESLASRESGFIFNNMIFLSMMCSVLWGTMYPIISEAIYGIKASIAAPYFNTIMVPIGLLLLALTGIGPVLSWKKSSSSSIIKKIKLPIFMAIIAVSVISVLLEIVIIYPIISIFLCAFVAATIIDEFYRGASVIRQKNDFSYLYSLIYLISRNRSRYGGYIVHLGIVMMFIGFTGKAFEQKFDVLLSKSIPETIENYEITLLDIKHLDKSQRANHEAQIIELQIVNLENNTKKYISPERRNYLIDGQPVDHPEVSVISKLNEDFYVVLGTTDIATNKATILVQINPMVSWVWIGILTLFIGSLICLIPRKKEYL